MITLTDAAAGQIRQHLQREESKTGNRPGLRLGVRKAGCSGWVYDLSYAGEPETNDTVVEDQGIQIFVTDQAREMVAGTIVDFKTEGLSSLFTFTNPNSTGECGCGESFTIDD